MTTDQILAHRFATMSDAAIVVELLARASDPDQSPYELGALLKTWDHLYNHGDDVHGCRNVYEPNHTPVWS